MASISIASISVPNWQGNSSGIQLRIYANCSFTAQSGTFYPLGNVHASPNAGQFYQLYACTVSSGSLVIPAVTLDSTADSPDDPSATYSAYLWDSNTGKLIQSFGTFGAFSLSPSPTSTTWAAIFTGADL